MANIQRNGTFSVIPRVAGGEITPDKLVVLGQVAKKYNLYTKITGGQRIDLFGAQKADLPDIWEELVNGGFESGHAYGKALRTVKSCVGTTWCRYGVGDSVGLAIQIENRYRGIRAPHKIKGGVSGCVRECAEAQNKDFGLIATDKGWNRAPLLLVDRLGADPRGSLHCGQRWRQPGSRHPLRKGCPAVQARQDTRPIPHVLHRHSRQAHSDRSMDRELRGWHRREHRRRLHEHS